MSLDMEDGRCLLKEITLLGGAYRYLTGTGLDINRASEEELSLLPGIGPSKARRIVDHIRENGEVRSAAELQWVHGIGPVTATRLERWFYWPEMQRRTEVSD